MSFRKQLRPIEDIYRQFFPKRFKDYKEICNRLKGLNGIEIGGPTSAFKRNGFLPIYKSINNLDNVNFSNETIWEGELIDGNNFIVENTAGKQFIREASDLKGIEDDSYSFLLSSHNIEHLANPLKAIQEWKRVVKPNGYFLFVVPNKKGTFDHRRPVSTFEHLKEDFESNIDERDDTHFQEVLDLHDLSKDPSGLDLDAFKKRTNSNFLNRCLHHHVFDLELLDQIAKSTSIEVLILKEFSTIHLVMLGINLKN